MSKERRRALLSCATVSICARSAAQSYRVWRPPQYERADRERAYWEAAVTTCWGAPRRTYDIRRDGLRTGDRADVVMLADRQRGLSRFVPVFLLVARPRSFGDGISSTLSERRN
jgi:hypothetical protein